MPDAAPTGETAPAATETTETTDTTTETTDTDLSAEVERWKTLSRKNERELRKAQSELEKTQQSSMTETERAVAEAKAQARSEALAEVQRDRVRDKVEAAAAKKLADPADAPALLGDLDQFIVGGEIDAKAIVRAIDKLVETKPYLSPQPGTGAGEGGPRGTSAHALNGDPLVRDLEAKLGPPR